MYCCCPICGDAIEKIIIRNAEAFGVRYDIYFCDRCGVGKTWPVIPQKELPRLYSSGNYRAEAGRRFHGLIETLISLSRLQRERRIRKYVDKGKVLDIGCGRGLFLDVMRRHGWTVKGVEFDRESAANASSAYGIDVIPASGMGSELPEGHFEVVTMYHVLEHVYDPVGTIRECARVLRKGGLLVVSVPNVLSLQAAFGRRDWFHLDPPYHMHHFSESGMKVLLKNHSFEVRRIRRFDWEQNVFGWLQTLLNRTRIRKNLFYDLLKIEKLRERQPAGRTGWGLSWTFLLLPIFVPVSLILSFFESYLLKNAGTFEVYATKS